MAEVTGESHPIPGAPAEEPLPAGNGPGSTPGGESGGGSTAAGGEERRPLSALIIDNLGVWAFIALAITALYGLWATLEVLTQWTGPMPGIEP